MKAVIIFLILVVVVAAKYNGIPVDTYQGIPVLDTYQGNPVFDTHQGIPMLDTHQGIPVLDTHQGIPVLDTHQGITVQNCGRGRAKTAGFKILGGTYAQHGRYPWMVSLHRYTPPTSFHTCGATVLNEFWVITAAHCIERNSKPSEFLILVGLYQQSRTNAPTVQKYQVSRIVRHEGFGFTTFQNDIALLRTAGPINIAGSKGYVNGICLPETTSDPDGWVNVIGWGHEYRDANVFDISDKLKTVAVPIVPRGQCRQAYYGQLYITENMICAGRKNEDSCQFDSGGPLFQTNSQGISTLIGIVSFGKSCGSEFYPGVYTKVASYINWIRREVSK